MRKKIDSKIDKWLDKYIGIGEIASLKDYVLFLIFISPFAFLAQYALGYDPSSWQALSFNAAITVPLLAIFCNTKKLVKSRKKVKQ